MTRAEIIADVTARQVPQRQAAGMVALAEFQHGLAVDQTCPECGQPVTVAGLPEGAARPRAWAVRCGCGEWTARGL